MASLLRGAMRLADRSARFAALDPVLNAARAAGLVRWGPCLSALVHASALRWPRRTAVIDDHGELSYRDLDRLADRLSNTLRRGGDSPVGLLCRNHRGFPLGQLAIERSGRSVVMLSTALPAGQLAGIIGREEIGQIIADDEFATLLDEASTTVEVLTGEPDQIESWGQDGFVRRPRSHGHVIMLTSGTTGPPKGARRSTDTPSMGDAGLLDALPIRMNDVTLIASPLFHAWGLAQANIALATGSTMVLQTRFDPGAIVSALVRHKVTVLTAVPIMFRRILDEVEPALDLPELRSAWSSGNILSATLANRWIGRFGPTLFNVYGSTETAIATVATPQDLVNAPGTVGRPPQGVTLAILDDHDQPLPTGQMGRVFTANSMQFDGYTDGSTRTRNGALMATGDLGYLDPVGRLFVDGRENDLIVTGGENVFPSQVEEVLQQHPLVHHAAVVGQADDDFGQRVVAYVVVAEGLDMAELDDWAKSQLGSFQRPRTFHAVDALPMTTTGKIMRHKLTPN